MNNKISIKLLLILFLFSGSIGFAQNDSLSNQQKHYKEYSACPDKIVSEPAGTWSIDKNGYYIYLDLNNKLLVEGAYKKKFNLMYFVRYFKREYVEDGLWKYCDEKGRLIKEETYKKGRFISRKEYPL
jgi:hypothetical protein